MKPNKSLSFFSPKDRMIQSSTFSSGSCLISAKWFCIHREINTLSYNSSFIFPVAICSLACKNKLVRTLCILTIFSSPFHCESVSSPELICNSGINGQDRNGTSVHNTHVRCISATQVTGNLCHL